MKRNKSMRFQFIQKKFLTYVLYFIMPMLIVGGSAIWNKYQKEINDVTMKLQNDSVVVCDMVDDIVKASYEFNTYLTSSGQLARFYISFSKNQLSYSDLLLSRQISAYLTSIATYRREIDSVYFYVSNANNRVITSEKVSMTVDEMGDQEWIKVLDEMKGGELKLSRREIVKDRYAQEKEISSVFLRFLSVRGGVVFNYDCKAVNQKISDLSSYEEQEIFVYSENGEMLFGTDEKGSDYWEDIEKAVSVSDVEKLVLGQKACFVSLAETEGGLIIMTMIPEKYVYRNSMANIGFYFIIILVTVVSCGLLAYFNARNSYNQLQHIVEIFHMENVEKLPLDFASTDIYGHILNNIIYTFVRSNALKQQLADKKYKQVVAELSALQYQINPHMIFNTLQVVNYEILADRKGIPGNANKMLENLSDILRYSLTEPGEMSTIKEELEICEKFIEIQKLRCDINLAFDYEIAAEFFDLRIPRLILQPVIENSIKHGFSDKETNCKIRLKVMRSSSETARVMIIDNGSGMSKENRDMVKKRLEEGESVENGIHIGLKNVKKRLELSFRQRVKLCIFSKEGVGTIVYFDLCEEKGEEYEK